MPPFKGDEENRYSRALYGADLTAHEQKIAFMAAQGMTNREIGDHLGLAMNTIKGHFQRMSHKTGIGDRTVLAVQVLLAALRKASESSYGDAAFRLEKIREVLHFFSHPDVESAPDVLGSGLSLRHRKRS